MSKIFVRERRQIGMGAGMPRFAVVAALGTDLRVFARHLRKAELEKLAQEAGLEVVYLPRGENAGEEDEEQQRGHGHGQGRRRGNGQGTGQGRGRGAMDQG